MLGIVGLVLLAARCYATWNAFVKASDDRLAGLVSINLIGAVLAKRCANMQSIGW